MDRDQARAFVREQMERYLQQKGIDPRKPFRCFNPDHEDRHPSMRYDPRRRKCHCFSCGADYDTLDLIAIDYGLTGGRAIFDKAFELFGIRAGEPPAASAQPAAIPAAREEDLSAYFEQCAARLGQTGYPLRRGLSREVLERFHAGFDPDFSPSGSRSRWEALILPTGDGCFVARNTDPDAGKRDRYRKHGTSCIFNAEALRSPSQPIFVVEGELDALSVMEASGEAVGLGSVANIRRFLSLAAQKKPSQPLLVSLDNDPSGQKASAELVDALTGMGLEARAVNLSGEEKDPNDALVHDREAFFAAVREAQSLETEARRKAREAYLQTSADYYLPSFLDGIAESVNTPFIPTGFPRLDAVLDGGLFEGLYILGAITSLGKTTLVTQIADQVAQSGHDVLIVSLEMARTELMAKSISRLTLLEALRANGNSRSAKTARGITTGSRWAGYSVQERELIHRAVKEFGDYAGNLYITEGIGDIGVREIRDLVARHAEFSGQVPVVVVDYLQILAPYSDRATDKQNTDRAVLELKRLSRDYKTPVIGISSFNRAGYREAVTMEAFKESGAIEYSSDVLIGLQLKGAGTPGFDAGAEKGKTPRAVELKVLKNRNGAAGCTVEFEYYPMFNYFKELSE